MNPSRRLETGDGRNVGNSGWKFLNKCSLAGGGASLLGLSVFHTTNLYDTEASSPLQVIYVHAMKSVDSVGASEFCSSWYCPDRSGQYIILSRFKGVTGKY